MKYLLESLGRVNSEGIICWDQSDKNLALHLISEQHKEIFVGSHMYTSKQQDKIFVGIPYTRR